MSDIELVIDLASELETALRECFGTSKSSLGKQLQEVKFLIPKSLYRSLIKIVEIRNRVIHNRESLPSTHEFRRDCEEALSDLQFIFALHSGVIILTNANVQRPRKQDRRNNEKVIIPVGNSRVVEISEGQSKTKSQRLLTTQFEIIENALQKEEATNGSVAGLRHLMNEHRRKINEEEMNGYEIRFAELGFMVANSVLKNEIRHALTEDIPSISSAKSHWKRIQDAEQTLSKFEPIPVPIQIDSRRAIIRLALFRYCKEINNAEREKRLGSPKKEQGHRKKAVEMLREDWPAFLSGEPIPPEPVSHCDNTSSSVS